ncbi:hypothetical protein CY0110_17852 [Crocosphaera chwakensis CCY0110]|uniref:Uncharacterized protein n=1 Tax=Crocosphaera chwakensis CCY0110 TaxID=391612 RepID=A3IIQ2_9CHRO|nr:hypothetical protein CY0110_17852 [Crocosphaera chwakensis CCY0110]
MRPSSPKKKKNTLKGKIFGGK